MDGALQSIKETVQSVSDNLQLGARLQDACNVVGSTTHRLFESLPMQMPTKIPFQPRPPKRHPVRFFINYTVLGASSCAVLRHFASVIAANEQSNRSRIDVHSSLWSPSINLLAGPVVEGHCSTWDEAAQAVVQDCSAPPPGHLAAFLVRVRSTFNVWWSAVASFSLTQPEDDSWSPEKRPPTASETTRQRKWVLYHAVHTLMYLYQGYLRIRVDTQERPAANFMTEFTSVTSVDDFLAKVVSKVGQVVSKFGSSSEQPAWSSAATQTHSWRYAAVGGFGLVLLSIAHLAYATGGFAECVKTLRGEEAEHKVRSRLTALHPTLCAADVVVAALTTSACVVAADTEMSFGGCPSWMMRSALLAHIHYLMHFYFDDVACAIHCFTAPERLSLALLSLPKCALVAFRGASALTPRTILYRLLCLAALRVHLQFSSLPFVPARVEDSGPTPHSMSPSQQLALHTQAAVVCPSVVRVMQYDCAVSALMIVLGGHGLPKWLLWLEFLTNCGLLVMRTYAGRSLLVGELGGPHGPTASDHVSPSKLVEAWQSFQKKRRGADSDSIDCKTPTQPTQQN